MSQHRTPQSHRSLAVLLLLGVLLAALALLAATAAPSRALTVPGDRIWTKTYAGDVRADVFYDIARGPGDAMYCVGITKATEEVSTLLLVKYSSSGQQLWVRTYKAPGVLGSAGMRVRVDHWGNILVAGTVGVTPFASSKGRNILVLKYDSHGKLLWHRTYDGPAHRDDYANDMAVDTLGNAYVVGASRAWGSGQDYIILKVRGDGRLLWQRRYGTTGADDARALALDPSASHNLYVTGSISGSPRQAATLKISPSGHVLWSKRLSAGSGSTGATSIAVAANGQPGVFVSGTTDRGAPTGEDVFLQKYAMSTGSTLWLGYEDESLGYDEDARDLAVDGAGNAVVVGQANDTINGYSYAIVAKWPSAGGAPFFHYQYYSSATGQASFDTVSIDGAGNLYLGGYLGSTATGLDFSVVKMPGSGDPAVWSGGLAMAGDDQCRALLVRPGTGGVYAVGQLTGATSSINAVAIKFAN
jgi:hypothetical protein